MSMALIASAVHLARGSVWISFALACVSVCFAMSPLVLRHRGSLSSTGNLLTFAWFGATAAVALSRGGVGSPAVFPALASPLLATLLAGRRSGIAWGGATLAFIAALFIAKSLGFELTDQVPAESRPAIHAAMGILFMLMTLGMGVAYDSLKATALEDVRRGEQEISRINEERVRAETEAKAMFADRMASVGRLSAGVAHEINNPLAYILTNLQFIHENLPRDSRELSGELSGAIRDALEGAQRIRAIVHDLKTFSRSEEEELAAVDVHEALDTAIRMVSNEARHRASVVRSYGDVPPAHATLSRLTQAFLNLLLNSIEAIPLGRAEDDRISVTTRRDGDLIAIEIADTGVGIAPEVLPRVTEPFFTTKPPGVGTGLGLSVTKSLVERFGGTLELTSTQGKGTTVTVRLKPAAKAAAAPAERAPAAAAVVVPAPAPSPSRARILIIDDEVSVARALSRMLREHDVVIVSRGLDALDVLAKDTSFDVIFCDLMLPDILGNEVFDRVRREAPAVSDRFVFMSGGVFSGSGRDFAEKMADRFLEKPFDQERLRALMKRTLAQRGAVA